MILLMLTMTGIASRSVHSAEDSSHITRSRPVGNTIPTPKPWSAIVGSRVRVEGIAWDTGKGLGNYVILDGAHVYVSGTDFLTQQAIGKLVRITGSLDRRKLEAGPSDVQGFAHDSWYYTIKVTEWSIIDTIDWPWVEELEPK
jgi:hypothetical protein